MLGGGFGVFFGGMNGKGKMLDQGIRIPAGGRVECLGFVVVTWDFVFWGYIVYFVLCTMINI